MEEAYPVKVVKVTSNDSVRMIYLPRRVCELLNLEKGDDVLLLIEPESKSLIVRRINKPASLEVTIEGRRE